MVLKEFFAEIELNIHLIGEYLLPMSFDRHPFIQWNIFDQIASEIPDNWENYLIGRIS